MELPREVRVAGVEHTMVALDGFDAHVATAGAGPAVVLLHGWPGHWWTWRHLIGPLAADGRRVICPDLRGFGWSTVPARGIALEQFATDLLALLDALGLDRVDLVGHDWGAFTGFIACLRAPRRVRRYVAMSAPGPHIPYLPSVFPHLWRLWYQQAIAAPVAGPRAVRGLGAARGPVARRIGVHRLAPEDLAVFARQFEDPARVGASVALYRHAVLNVFRMPLMRRYRRARLTVPTLAVHGALDGPTHPALMRAMGRRADDFRLEVLDGVGHFVPDEAPETVSELVRGFLAA